MRYEGLWAVVRYQNRDSNTTTAPPPLEPSLASSYSSNLEVSVIRYVLRENSLNPRILDMGTLDLPRVLPATSTIPRCQTGKSNDGKEQQAGNPI